MTILSCPFYDTVCRAAEGFCPQIDFVRLQRHDMIEIIGTAFPFRGISPSIS
jgi:hypothetical protein